MLKTESTVMEIDEEIDSQVLRHATGSPVQKSENLHGTAPIACE